MISYLRLLIHNSYKDLRFESMINLSMMYKLLKSKPCIIEVYANVCCIKYLFSISLSNMLKDSPNVFHEGNLNNILNDISKNMQTTTVSLTQKLKTHFYK